MKDRLCFGIVACLVCCAFLFAQSNPSSNEQKQEPPASPGSPSQVPSTDGHAVPSTSPGRTPPPVRFVKICSNKNPPPCATPPHVVSAPDPEYSKEARNAHYQGTCVLWVVVGADGNVPNVKVVRGLGHGLDKKAVETVKGWRFEPAREDGQPVAVQVNVEVSFRLYSAPPKNSPQFSGIVVSPVLTWVVAGSQQQFSVKVPGVSNPSLTWSVSGDGCEGSACGIIAANGLYTAPSNVPDFPTVIVTATMAGVPVKIGSATVNIQASPSEGPPGKTQ